MCRTKGRDNLRRPQLPDSPCPELDFLLKYWFSSSPMFTGTMQTSVSSQNITDTEKTMYTRGQVAQHTQEGDIWIIIENDVYNLGQFLQEHPGGAKSRFSGHLHGMDQDLSLIQPTVLLDVAGQDATKKFKKYHRLAILNQYKDRFLVGGLEQNTGNDRSLRSSIISIFRRS